MPDIVQIGIDGTKHTFGVSSAVFLTDASARDADTMYNVEQVILTGTPVNFPTELTGASIWAQIYAAQDGSGATQVAWNETSSFVYTRVGTINRSDPNNPVASWGTWNSVATPSVVTDVHVEVDPVGQEPGTYLVIVANTDSGESTSYALLTTGGGVYTSGNGGIAVSTDNKISLVISPASPGGIAVQENGLVGVLGSTPGTGINGSPGIRGMVRASAKLNESEVTTDNTMPASWQLVRRQVSGALSMQLAPIYLTDLNTLTRSYRPNRMYIPDLASITSNCPPGASGEAMVTTEPKDVTYTGNYSADAVQTLSLIGRAGEWRRSCVNSIWTPWVRIDTDFLGTPIPGGADLNTYTTPGRYQCPVSVQGTILNTPSTLGARVFVLDVRYVDDTVQLQTLYRMTTPVVWSRPCVSGVWGAWQRFLTDTADNGLLSPANGGVFAQGQINADGSIAYARNIASVTKVSAGNYAIVYSTPYSAGAIITPVIQCMEYTVPISQVIGNSITGFTARLRTLNGTQTDTTFKLIVV